RRREWNWPGPAPAGTGPGVGSRAWTVSGTAGDRCGATIAPAPTGKQPRRIPHERACLPAWPERVLALGCGFLSRHLPVPACGPASTTPARHESTGDAPTVGGRTAHRPPAALAGRAGQRAAAPADGAAPAEGSRAAAGGDLAAGCLQRRPHPG